MRNETFYVIVDNNTLEYQQFTGEPTTELSEAVKFKSVEETQKYILEMLDEDFQEHCLIYKVDMHYYLEKVGR